MFTWRPSLIKLIFPVWIWQLSLQFSCLFWCLHLRVWTTQRQLDDSRQTEALVDIRQDFDHSWYPDLTCQFLGLEVHYIRHIHGRTTSWQGLVFLSRCNIGKIILHYFITRILFGNVRCGALHTKQLLGRILVTWSITSESGMRTSQLYVSESHRDCYLQW